MKRARFTEEMGCSVRQRPARHARAAGLVLTAQNGIPWVVLLPSWRQARGTRILESVNPGGAIARALPAERVIGSVVYGCGEARVRPA